MSWQNILKYNREHYVKAGRKHNDPNVIEAHKEILNRVKNSRIKDRKMGRQIRRTLIGLPTPPKEYDMKLLREEGSLVGYLKEVRRYRKRLREEYNTFKESFKEKKNKPDEEKRVFKIALLHLDEYIDRLTDESKRMYSINRRLKEFTEKGVTLRNKEMLRRALKNHNRNLKYIEETLDKLSRYTKK
tara:strand:- start:4080 stop:4640 length:561 start_codon:yes stop_codon:yes gene_type:complete